MIPLIRICYFFFPRKQRRSMRVFHWDPAFDTIAIWCGKFAANDIGFPTRARHLPFFFARCCHGAAQSHWSAFEGTGGRRYHVRGSARRLGGHGLWRGGALVCLPRLEGLCYGEVELLDDCGYASRRNDSSGMIERYIGCCSIKLVCCKDRTFSSSPGDQCTTPALE